jgi:amidase
MPLVPASPDVAGRRVAWFGATPGAKPDAATLAALETAVRALGDAGATVIEAAPPRLDESMPITQAYWQRVQSLSWREWLPDKRETLSSMEIERSLFEWDRFRRAMTAFTEPYDAVLCPVAAAPAPAHGAITREDYIFTLPFSLTGWPVATVRAGSAPDGMPIGVQVAGPAWHEADVLAVAAVIERATGGWQPAP